MSKKNLNPYGNDVDIQQQFCLKDKYYHELILIIFFC